MNRRDVVIVGAGLSGLVAAHHLRVFDIEVIEAADDVGGRTKSTALPNGLWINYGAQYVTSDRPKVVELADSVGARLLPSPNYEDYLTRLLPSAIEERAEVQSTIVRIEAEQAKPRPPVTPDLDDQSFGNWLGELSPGASRYFDEVCQLMQCGSFIELSLYGALWIWGSQRSTPWNDVPVERHDRGECVFDGGTGRFAKALAGTIDNRISLRTQVTRIETMGAEYVVSVKEGGRTRSIVARHVVSSVPAPVAYRLIPALPEWKRQALKSVRYGRWISTPIVIAPRNGGSSDFALSASRPSLLYNADLFMGHTPGDTDEIGRCYHSFMADPAARLVWDDPEESIKSGAVRALLRQFPEYRYRIARVDIHRWKHGLPLYSVGHMKQLDNLSSPVDGIYFCGDYTWASNMEGAVRSGLRAARQLLAAGSLG